MYTPGPFNLYTGMSVGMNRTHCEPLLMHSTDTWVHEQTVVDLIFIGQGCLKMYNYFKDHKYPWHTRADVKYVIIAGSLSGFNIEKIPMISYLLTLVMVVQ